MKIKNAAICASFFLGAASVLMAAPTISNVTLNAASVGKYDKIEITFQISNVAATNLQWPYDASPPSGIPAGAGITVNAVLTSPSGQTYIQPAFYYQDFTVEQRQNRDWFYPTGNYSWKVRFSPTEVGAWSCQLTAQDSSGSGSANTSFSATASMKKGFVRVSPTDSRYFEFEDGSYFPGLGLNYGANTDDIEANEARFQMWSANGIQLIRTWLSQWAIQGSAWNPWNGVPQQYDGYLPRAGLDAVDGAFRLKMSYRPNNGSFWKASRFVGWLQPWTAAKPNTTYRVRVRYQAMNITGPRVATSPNYGLVAKVGGWMDFPEEPLTGSTVTAYGHNIATWTELTGTWRSGNNVNYLPMFYLTLENVDGVLSGPAATAWVDYVVVEEDLGGGNYGPNLLSRPSMNHHTYFDQRMSLAFDRLVNLAEVNGIYLKPVIMEKDEYTLNHILNDGSLTASDNLVSFYTFAGTPVRWLQQAWWRYLQARWGYSTAIHSWELLNEGDPNSSGHFDITDALGAYMRQFRPNHHMVSTSLWHSFPATDWQSRTNIDFADVHYYQPRSSLGELNDTALATYNRSVAYDPGVSKPIIRGETGFVESGSDPSIPEFGASPVDSAGLWLHKFIWGQINRGGMMESYWYVTGPDGHVWNSVSNLNHHSKFGNYYRFIQNVPLSDGHYTDAQASTTTATMRVWGQKDLVHGRAHLWIQNMAHTWRNVADGVSVAPVSGTVTLTGFVPNTSYTAEWWDTTTGAVASSQSVTSNGSGNVVLTVNNLTTDTAVKIYGAGGGDSTAPAAPRGLRFR